MNKENDFFNRCFNIVASLEVQNENQLIAKEVVLDEIESLQTENQQLKKERNTMSCLVNDLQETLEEIREFIQETCWYSDLENYSNMTDDEVKELVKIINKGKCENVVSDTQEKCDKGVNND